MSFTVAEWSLYRTRGLIPETVHMISVKELNMELKKRNVPRLYKLKKKEKQDKLRQLLLQERKSKQLAKLNIRKQRRRARKEENIRIIAEQSLALEEEEEEEELKRPPPQTKVRH